MEHRRQMEIDVVWPRAQAHGEAELAGYHVGAGDAYALGAAGGAAGVLQDGVVAGFRGCDPGCAGPREEIVVMRHAVGGIAGEADQFAAPGRQGRGVVGGQELRGAENRVALGVGQDVLDFRCREPPVDGNRHGARAKAGPFQLVEAGRVGGLNGKTATFSQSEPAQHVGGHGDPFAQFGPAETGVTVDDRRTSALMAYRAVEELSERQHGVVLLLVKPAKGVQEGKPATASISIFMPGIARAATSTSVLAGLAAPKNSSRTGLILVRSSTSVR